MEGLSKAALIKSLSPRVMLSNHLLPKGTKMKVNLEDQGRQKVSFSLAQTKKPRQSLFFIPTSPEKSVAETHSTLSQSNLDKRGQTIDGKTEQKLPTSPAETLSQVVVSPTTKLKTDLAKVHFKKQILSVSVTEEKSTSVVPEEPNSSELQGLKKSTSKSVAEFPLPHPQNAVSVCSSEKAPTEAPETKAAPSLKRPVAPSGKDSESSSSADQDINMYRRKTRSQSDSAPPGSESDGDSVLMSSSRKSPDSKRKISVDSRSKDVKKSSFGSHGEDKEKSSSKRSENHESSCSYSKSDRDSRHTSSRSCRSDKDRRRTRSRSRSRSRGPRTTSAHSRSDRLRGDRGSRSERSYYHDSDRRSHRSSPRRERRRSRSRTDRTRDSSDSEDDHRKARTRASDSSRPSAYSSSRKDSKSSSYSKSEKAYKSSDSPHSSESDKRTQSSKSERTSKRLSDSDCQRKSSPDPDSSYRKSSSHHKLETNSKSSSSNLNSHSQSYEKHQKCISSDSEADHKGKSDKSSGSDESNRSSQKKTSVGDTKQMTPPGSAVKTSEHDRQSTDVFQSPDRAPLCASTAESCSQRGMEIPDGHLVSNEDDYQTFMEKVSVVDQSLQESSKRRETTFGLEVENDKAAAITFGVNLKRVNIILENLTNLKGNYSSKHQQHPNSTAVVLNSCSGNDSIACSLEKNLVASSPGSTSLDTADAPVTHDTQQNRSQEAGELNVVSTVSERCGTDVSLKSESPCIESENHLILKPQNIDTPKKKSGTTKKSRWDIVGQDTPDSDNSQRTSCAESKPTVIKVISLKKIEFSKDNMQQDSDIKNTVLQETETHSTHMKQIQMFKQEVTLESMSVTENYRDQSRPSKESPSGETCDFNQSVSQKANTGEPLHTNSGSQLDKNEKTTSWIGDYQEDIVQDSVHKTKTSKRTMPNPDVSGGLSEASDSDNSEYDSDCGEAIKRLHSVVVVPKNSSLSIDLQDTGASPCTPMNSSEPQNANIIADVNTSVVPQQRQANPSGAVVEASGSHALMNDSSFKSMLCQSQSNMIDSTSHSEGAIAISAQPCMAGQISLPGSTTGPVDISRQYEQQHEHYTSSRGEDMYSHYQPDDFSNVDNIDDKNAPTLVWDFSQSEQPSSTYQQPDSSHGPFLPTSKMTGVTLKQQEHMQSNVLWNLSLNMQSNRKTYHSVPDHYQDPASEVHPDSLTNDHDDYSGDKSSNLIKTAVECSDPNTSGSSSFVQGYEISSNSRGSAVPDPPREDSFRPHRGRGPPKKRRPEVESDSDNEAEAGPADKRERLGDEVSKESQIKTEIYHPSLTLQDFQDASKWKEFSKSKKMPPYFDLIEENLYLTER